MTLKSESDIFMRVTNLCEFAQNGPLDKFMWFLFMRPCIVTYGAIKTYVVQIHATGTWLK